MKYSLLLFFVCCASAFSQELFFNYRVEDRPFLHYYSMWNQFDSSAVMFRFGEVHFVNERLRKNLHLSLAFPDRINIQDGGIEGVSAKLQGMARTENFTIPGAGEIRWFGQLQSFKTPCDLSGKRDEPNKPFPSWGIVDRTEFVVQLVDAATNSVLAVLDSVGVSPTTPSGSPVDTRYGEHVEQVKRSATIPASYAGKQVYVRVSPRRYGPTAYGLAITRFDSWFNLTAEWDETGANQLPISFVDSLRSVWLAGLITYCDSVKAETGWLPDLHHITFAKRSGLPIYQNRYFNPQVDATGDTAWVEKRTLPLGKRSAGATMGIAGIKSIAPNPVAGESVDITLISGFDAGYQLELLSTDGRRLGILWRGSLNRGRAELTIPIPKNLANGTYLLLLEQDTGERVHEKTFVIAR